MGFPGRHRPVPPPVPADARPGPNRASEDCAGAHSPCRSEAVCACRGRTGSSRCDDGRGRHNRRRLAAAAAVKMRLYLYASNFVGTIDICNPTIFKRTTGELIVDGSITTDKLAANSITSAKILAGSIQAAHIAAGTITGDRIAANQTLTAPNISGGSANFGGGRVTITSAGVFSLRADPTSNIGMQITNDTLMVYDENGNLRVKIGKLS